MRSPEQPPQRRTPESFIKIKDRLSGIGWSVNHQLAARRVRENIESSTPTERLFDTHFDLLSHHSSEQLKTVLYTTAIASGVREKNAHRKIRRALKIADYAHQEQTRKFSPDSYKVHPMRAAILAMDLARAMGVKVTTELIVGAILHDTIEDNHEAIYPGFLQEYYKDMGSKYAWGIEADAEALSKYVTVCKTGERIKLEGQDYASKITTMPVTDNQAIKESLLQIVDDNDVKKSLLGINFEEDANEALLRRIIIKTADRLDNLLDPPIYTPSYAGEDNLTDARIKVIGKTVNKDVKPLLETHRPVTDKLLKILNTSLVIAERSITDPDFDPKKWREYALAA